jgi:hypothetical protein
MCLYPLWSLHQDNFMNSSHYIQSSSLKLTPLSLSFSADRIMEDWEHKSIEPHVTWLRRLIHIHCK